MVSLLFSPFGETVFNDGCFFPGYVQKIHSCLAVDKSTTICGNVLYNLFSKAHYL